MCIRFAARWPPPSNVVLYGLVITRKVKLHWDIGLDSSAFSVYASCSEPQLNVDVPSEGVDMHTHDTFPHRRMRVHWAPESTRMT